MKQLDTSDKPSRFLTSDKRNSLFYSCHAASPVCLLLNHLQGRFLLSALAAFGAAAGLVGILAAGCCFIRRRGDMETAWGLQVGFPICRRWSGSKWPQGCRRSCVIHHPRAPSVMRPGGLWLERPGMAAGRGRGLVADPPSLVKDQAHWFSAGTIKKFLQVQKVERGLAEPLRHRRQRLLVIR